MGQASKLFTVITHVTLTVILGPQVLVLSSMI